MFREAMFQDVKIEGVPVIYQFNSAENYLDFAYENSRASLGSRIATAYPDGQKQEEIRKAILEEAKWHVILKIDCALLMKPY